MIINKKIKRLNGMGEETLNVSKKPLIMDRNQVRDNLSDLLDVYHFLKQFPLEQLFELLPLPLNGDNYQVQNNFYLFNRFPSRFPNQERWEILLSHNFLTIDDFLLVEKALNDS